MTKEHLWVTSSSTGHPYIIYLLFPLCWKHAFESQSITNCECVETAYVTGDTVDDNKTRCFATSATVPVICITNLWDDSERTGPAQFFSSFGHRLRRVHGRPGCFLHTFLNLLPDVSATHLLNTLQSQWQNGTWLFQKVNRQVNYAIKGHGLLTSNTSIFVNQRKCS